MFREVIKLSLRRRYFTLIIQIFYHFCFFKQINKRRCNNKIIINKTSIKIYKIQKNLHVSIILK